MVSTLIGKQAVVIGAGMGGLTRRGRSPTASIRWLFWSATLCPRSPRVARGRHKPGTSMRCCLAPARPQRAVPRVRAGSRAGGSRAAQGRSGCSHGAPGLRSLPQRDLGWFSYAVSRPTIERAVRQRVESRANTTLRQRCRVQEVLASPNGEAVTGVRYENGNGASETIAADLVVDASGRGALTLALLQSIGRPLPEETTIGIDLGYATCVFAIPDDASTDWKGVMTFGQAPQNSRGGLMLPLEDNRWMATIGGRHGDVPTGDAEGFLTYARALRTPTIYNAISHAKRLDGVARYGFPESVRRHFERLDVFPRGLLPSATQSAASIPSTAKA